MSLDTKEKDMQRFGYYLEHFILAQMLAVMIAFALYVLALNFGVI